MALNNISACAGIYRTELPINQAVEALKRLAFEMPTYRLFPDNLGSRKTFAHEKKYTKGTRG